MKRVYTSVSAPGEGAVYRYLEPCESDYSGSSEACGGCISTEAVDVISGPGCSDFPITDNDYGNLPTFFGGDTDIDTYLFDDRWSSLSPFPSTDPTCPTPPTLKVGRLP